MITAEQLCVMSLELRGRAAPRLEVRYRGSGNPRSEDVSHHQRAQNGVAASTRTPDRHSRGIRTSDGCQVKGGIGAVEGVSHSPSMPELQPVRATVPGAPSVVDVSDDLPPNQAILCTDPIDSNQPWRPPMPSEQMSPI